LNAPRKAAGRSTHLPMHLVGENFAEKDRYIILVCKIFIISSLCFRSGKAGLSGRNFLSKNSRTQYIALDGWEWLPLAAHAFNSFDNHDMQLHLHQNGH
jgi:hypothetical protein